MCRYHSKWCLLSLHASTQSDPNAGSIKLQKRVYSAELNLAFLNCLYLRTYMPSDGLIEFSQLYAYLVKVKEANL